MAPSLGSTCPESHRSVRNRLRRTLRCRVRMLAWQRTSKAALCSLYNHLRPPPLEPAIHQRTSSPADGIAASTDGSWDCCESKPWLRKRETSSECPRSSPLPPRSGGYKNISIVMRERESIKRHLKSKKNIQNIHPPFQEWSTVALESSSGASKRTASHGCQDNAWGSDTTSHNIVRLAAWLANGREWKGDFCYEYCWFCLLTKRFSALFVCSFMSSLIVIVGISKRTHFPKKKKRTHESTNLRRYVKQWKYCTLLMIYERSNCCQVKSVARKSVRWKQTRWNRISQQH